MAVLQNSSPCEYFSSVTRWWAVWAKTRSKWNNKRVCLCDGNPSICIPKHYEQDVMQQNNIIHNAMNRFCGIQQKIWTSLFFTSKIIIFSNFSPNRSLLLLLFSLSYFLWLDKLFYFSSGIKMQFLPTSTDSSKVTKLMTMSAVNIKKLQTILCHKFSSRLQLRCHTVTIHFAIFQTVISCYLVRVICILEQFCHPPLQPWRFRQHPPLKCMYLFTKLHVLNPEDIQTVLILGVCILLRVRDQVMGVFISVVA
jgi:hypothetical protein